MWRWVAVLLCCCTKRHQISNVEFNEKNPEGFSSRHYAVNLSLILLENDG
jgi:hypothetical protein